MLDRSKVNDIHAKNLAVIEETLKRGGFVKATKG